VVWHWSNNAFDFSTLAKITRNLEKKENSYKRSAKLQNVSD
jgi:hypothetical protein